MSITIRIVHAITAAFFLVLSTTCNTLYTPDKNNPVFTIMIDPAGDTRNAGRQIDDSFERGLTLQCAEHIKKYLEDHYPQVRVILTRFPGETVQPLQHANFANRLNVDLYVTLHFYHEQTASPGLSLITCCPDIHSLSKNTPGNSFIPYDQAHNINSKKTLVYAETAYEFLSHQKYRNMFHPRIISLPFKPLLGIIPPAFGIEVGLKEKGNWVYYVEPIAESLNAVMHKATTP